MWALVKRVKIMLKLSFGIFLIFLLSIFSFNPVLANESHEGATTDSVANEGFNAGKFIIEHVSDAYDWHVVSFGHTHISIPLPIILYSKNPELQDLINEAPILTGYISKEDKRNLER